MNLNIFPRSSVKGYSIFVLVVAAWLAIGILTDEPEWGCACAVEPGSVEYQMEQQFLAEARAERPQDAAIVFGLTLIGGAVVFGVLTAMGIALRPVLGPYE